MNFNHTEERRMLQDSLRRFFAGQYTREVRATAVASAQGHSPSIWSQMAELGVIAALFDEEHGGFGGHGFDLAVVFEEMGRAAVTEPLLYTGVLAAGLMADLGNAEQQSLLEQTIEGHLQLAFAHSEPGSRYDPSRVTTRAVARGDNFVLNGQKAVVVNGGNAQWLVVSARTAGTVADTDGLSLFLVPADADGIGINCYRTLDDARAAEITLTDVSVPATALLGNRDEAFPAIEKRIAAGTVALCAEAVGLMETIKSLTVEYLKTRQQFGQPIGKFQALQHRMADVLIEIEQARSAMINVAGHLDQVRALREKHVSAAKNLIGRAGKRVVEESIQMHGGMGVTESYDLSRYARRLTLIDHQLGDTDYHLERFILLSQQAPTSQQDQ